MSNISRRIKGVLFVFFGMPLYAVIQYLVTLLFEVFSGDLSVFQGQISLIISGLIMLFIMYAVAPLFSDTIKKPKITPKSIAAILLIGLLLTLSYDLLAIGMNRQFVIPLESVSDGSVLSLFLYFLLSVTIAPVIEELFFRGFLWKTIGEWGGSLFVKVIISSLFWAFLHGQYDLWDRGFLILLGGILGVLRSRSSGIYGSVLLHVVINCIAYVQTLLF